MKKKWIWAVWALALITLWPVMAGAEAGGEPVQVVEYVHSDGADSGAMLEAYIDVLSDYAGPTARGVGSVGAQLQYANAALYKTLRPLFEQVANGQRASTQFSLTYEELGLPTSYTAKELGVSAIVDADGNITAEAKAAADARFYPVLKPLNDALLADCPFALYWFDKLAGTAVSYYNYSYNAQSVSIWSGATVDLYYYVASEYQAGGPFSFNTGVSATIQAAVNRAAGIVSQYAAASDYEKLVGYKQAICDLTSYNDAAAGGGAAFGNPWQLIWVFDNDPSTTVVCEGYAKAFQYLCDLTDFTDDVTCVSVSGLTDGGAHMWNLVRMPNDKVYMVDVTNCDEGKVGSPDFLFLAGYTSGSVEDGYVFHRDRVEWTETVGNVIYTHWIDASAPDMTTNPKP